MFGGGKKYKERCQTYKKKHILTIVVIRIIVVNVCVCVCTLTFQGKDFYVLLYIFNVLNFNKYI